MGWRGALRSIVAAQRAAEREGQRRQRLLEKAEKLQARLEALQDAALAVGTSAVLDMLSPRDSSIRLLFGEAVGCLNTA
jgi:hypothetical protein